MYKPLDVFGREIKLGDPVIYYRAAKDTIYHSILTVREIGDSYIVLCDYKKHIEDGSVKVRDLYNVIIADLGYYEKVYGVSNE